MHTGHTTRTTTAATGASFVYTPAMEFTLDAKAGAQRRIDAGRAKVEAEETVAVKEHAVTFTAGQSHLTDGNMKGHAWENLNENQSLFSIAHTGTTRSLMDFESPTPAANMKTMRLCTLVLDDAQVDLHESGVPTVQIGDKIQQLDGAIGSATLTTGNTAATVTAAVSAKLSVGIPRRAACSARGLVRGRGRGKG